MQFKKAGIFSGNGFLQLSILGGQEVHGSAAAARGDENAIIFYPADNKRYADIVWPTPSVEQVLKSHE